MKNNTIILAILASGVFSGCNVKRADTGNNVIAVLIVP